MNNKRQTIWLVSMLSLMVILSAYYLFTEEVTPTDQATNITDQTKSVTIQDDGIVVTDLNDQGDNTTTSSGMSQEDEAVLQEYSNLKGVQLLSSIQLTKRENIDKQYTELNAIIADTKNHSQEEASDAATKLSLLDDADERMTSLEEKLLVDFDNAVVTEENTNYKVILLSDKIDRKQAVTIVDLAMKELQTTPDRISIQIVQ
ncbi:MAG: SpoIIIAH-like family protein [Candidatus Cohnella colombiensis]|uniref:SpoIIIAH-like family protein n=1 Tax=Candidatus Cohnella colombiensis TaxID=3121368 RepID=A0AA95JE18_9BACL|nr:MAG: SpoIIIAH-like family protein [Cohnella sp.]